MRWFRMVWAAPWSLVGLALGLTFGSRRKREGVVLCEGASWPRRVGWRYRAITFGHVVLCVDAIDRPTFEHELVHVRQYERWGPFFVPAYLVASLVALARGRRAYLDNRFEVEARVRSEGGRETYG